MIIETRIYHGAVLIKERCMISETELQHAKDPEAIIRTAKRICAARVIQKWAAHLKEQNK